MRVAMRRNLRDASAALRQRPNEDTPTTSGQLQRPIPHSSHPSRNTHTYTMAAMTSTFLGSAVAVKAPVTVAKKAAVAPVASLDGLKKVRVPGDKNHPRREGKPIASAMTRPRRGGPPRSVAATRAVSRASDSRGRLAIARSVRARSRPRGPLATARPRASPARDRRCCRRHPLPAN